jgi:hypothetical protein
MPDLDEFTRAYIEAALWSTNDDYEEPLDTNYDIDDIAPDALATIIADCQKFQAGNEADLALAYDLYPQRDWSPESQAGHDFWLTRNRHGAGFWDRGISEVGDRLTDASHECGEVFLYIGDDGAIYC